MAIVGTPVILGYLSLLKLKKEQIGFEPNIGNPGYILLPILIIFQFGLNLISVFLTRPINGVGQSVFIPIFTVVISAFATTLVSWKYINSENLRAAAEYLLIFIYSFVLLNIFYPMVVWSKELSEDLIFSNDGYRYSPFANILKTPGRQSFFESDPEKFAIFSFLAFVVLFISSSTLRKSIGSLLVVLIGSTTQSRLFYLGIVIVVFIFVLDNFFKKSIFLRTSILFTLITGNLLFASLFASQSTTGLSSFSGRNYIWEIVLKYWDREGKFLAHLGSYSLAQFSESIESRLKFFHAHNLILQYLWDWGLLGLVLIISLLLSFAIFGLRMSRPGYLILCALLIVGFIESSFIFTFANITFLPVLLLIKYAGESRKVVNRIG